MPLREYQRSDIDRWAQNDYRGGWYWEPGLGKTYSAAAVVKYMLKTQKATRAMIMAPKVALSVWHNFLVDNNKIPEKHIYNYQKMSNKKDQSIKDVHRIFLMNFELSPVPEKKKKNKKVKVIPVKNEDGRLTFVEKKVRPSRKEREFPDDIDLWVIDESHYLKSHTSNAYNFLKTKVKKNHKLLILSGTPFPNKHVSCYTQLNLISPGVLGKNISRFREEYCFCLNPQFGTYVLKYDKVPEVEHIAAQWCSFRKTKDHLDLPKHNDIILTYDINPDQQKMLKGLMNTKKGMVESTTGVMIKPSAPVTNFTMMQQVLSGYISMNIKDAFTKTHFRVEQDFNARGKFEVLLQLLEVLDGKKLIVWTNFKPTAKDLKQRLTVAGYKTDAVTGDDKADLMNRIKAFVEGDVQIMIAHPLIIGISVNYFTPINYMLWYELTFNWAVYKQAVDRIHRFGQKNPTFCYHLVSHKTDKAIYNALQEKEDVSESFIQTFMEQETK